ncbi:hypothetical protein COEREDRAFT_104060 [Coemansia reversa NRRL 1564]|uniref:Actin cytoskeleton-regulatory complex protein PAN1 n=1 Tax=Coemansia reversa (strain ATCC 12441 / NRRL 1564) TaxID=763665 RepID=A0A2G5B3A6_COERN|nr:hypothetical protein COEREDRAFT_104060 [Coemansia reversa NRRL 1564]|eukprot:PIA13498.1 hypothetical protein COEREDRAFT_104060 [Coemansia reversa NRRL 1564]
MNAQGQPVLSFVSADDLATYVRSFQSNVASGSTRIGGDAARRVLLQSRLPVNELGQIWELSDTRKQGCLTVAEFALAMFLAQSRIRGKSLPTGLPPKIAAEIAAANSTIDAGTAMQPNMLAPQKNTLQMSMPIRTGTPVGVEMALRPSSAATAAGKTDVESVEDFESRYPDIAPTSTTTGGGGRQQQRQLGRLQSVRQSFHQDMLGPRAGSQQQHEWAIGANERAQYEAIFRRWDPGHRGVLRGEQAREVFAQSGLPQHELARVWSLADINNQGELNLDEFSVAMHLIFRRLAGALIPDQLPADLVPRSSKNFMDSLNTMKEQLMFKDTPRSHTPVSAARAEADDDDGDDLQVYRSANRHRNPRASASSVGRNSPAPKTSTPVSSAVAEESVDQLRARVRQRKEEVAQLKADSERQSREQAEGRVTQRWRVDELKREIEDIHRATPLVSAAAVDGGSEADDRARFLAKRRRLVASIRELVRLVPTLTAEYERLSLELAEASKDVLRREAEQKKRTGSDAAADDDMGARAARLVAQRMAALTGQSLDEIDGSSASAKEEAERIDCKHRERIERMQSVTAGLSRVQHALSDLHLDDMTSDSAADTRKWEDGAGVEAPEVKDLINRLQGIPKRSTAANQPSSSSMPPVTETSAAQRLANATDLQERERILQEIAEERFRERQQALGISEPKFIPTKPINYQPLEEPPRRAAASPKQLPTANKMPEMSQRTDNTTAANNNDDLLGLGIADVSAKSNPFAASNPQDPLNPPASSASAARDVPGYAAIFDHSLEVDDFSDSSSDDEWDRDDSSDEESLSKNSINTADHSALNIATAAAIAAAMNDDVIVNPAATHTAVDLNTDDSTESPKSNVSFNTAFANPAAGASSNSKNASGAASASNDETNPFLGLLAASENAPSGIPTVAAGLNDTSDFKKLRAKALYPYNASSESEELSISTGDLIETRPVTVGNSSTHAHSAEDGWMYGEILGESKTDNGDGWESSGKIGWFPKDYVEILGDPDSRGWIKTNAKFGAAKYGYDPQHKDELKVKVDDRVRVIDGDIAESWWKVRKIDTGEEGMLPAIYIELDK